VQRRPLNRKPKTTVTLVTDKIKIKCPKCGKEFKEQARKIRADFSMPCPHCQDVVKFEDGSPNERIRRALSAARKLRRQGSSLFPKEANMSKSDLLLLIIAAIALLSSIVPFQKSGKTRS
jgi:endogenous inhibitor of DNA gyrase (YacG/DUF329 family)